MKYYHRGNGEVVEIPIKDFPAKVSQEEIRRLTASIPASKIYVCDPKEPIGWLQGYKERYEIRHAGKPGVFQSCHKKIYDSIDPLVYDRRIFLEPVADKGGGCRPFKRQTRFYRYEKDG